MNTKSKLTKLLREYLLPAILFLFLVFTLSNCKKDESTDLIGNWIELSQFNGDARMGAVAFTINNISYVGSGYNGEERLVDFWAYNPEQNSWTQKANFAGTARNSAIAFTAAGKGYVGTGWDGYSYLSDFWKYDPGLNSWTEVADLADYGGTARYGAVAFSIDDMGYIGTGYDGNYKKDLYIYNPVADTFGAISFDGDKRRDAVAFVIDGKGYICTGIENGEYVNDLFEYDPGTKIWTKKRAISNVSDEDYDNKYTILRAGAVVFVMDGKAYITTGRYTNYTTDTWEYDPVTDLWTQKTSFEGSSRSYAVSFTSEDGRGFVALGSLGTTSTSAFNDDLYEFKPADTYDEDD
jgi:N-acetylneuraminic acid mutarotase